MKRILTSALVLALTIGAAQAQTATPEKQKGHKKEQKMAYKKLNLTADQKAQMKTIREGFKNDMAALKKQDNITVAEMKNRRQALHQEYQNKMQALLTADQKLAFEKMKADHKANGRHKQGNKNAVTKSRRANRQRGDMLKQLDLTADQQQKMKELRSSFRTDAQALRNDKSLTQEQKKEKMKTLAKDQQKQVKTILTKEQIEKMQELRKDRTSRDTK